jgi:hypothetical protein
VTNESSGAGSWWATLPGILTAIAAVITALTGLLAILAQNGVLGEKSKSFITGQTEVVSSASVKPEVVVANDKPTAGTGITEVQLARKPFTGAVVTMTDGTVIKLRDNIREYCGSVAALRTIQGQTIKMDIMNRFDIIDWSSQKGAVKITLINGEVLNVSIDACYFEGRNDLGDFRGDFSQIRSVEFVR